MLTDPDFEALLVHLKEARGFDFTGYKRSSLMRRVNRRLSQLDIQTYADYLDHLEVHPAEFTALFNTILINVTGFLRDPDAWEYLRSEVVVPMLTAPGREGEVRVWSAGCASGQEAYTLAMLLCEVLGADEFRRSVKIYATDVDEESLSHARLASYGERDVRGVPPELLERYFERVGPQWSFRKELRRSVIFGRNDLVQDAPISRIDLLVCRNTLMYFNAETQARILGRFHFALRETGALLLGKAEMLLSHGNLFMPLDLQRRVFRRVPRGGGHVELPVIAAPPAGGTELGGLDRLRAEAFQASPVAQVVVTADGLVAMSNRRAEAAFGISAKDVGRPFRDLDLSFRPVELRGYIEQAQLERRTMRISGVELGRGPDTVFLDVEVEPLADNGTSLLGVTVIFNDVTAAHRLQLDLEQANRQLESAYEELQSTVEELETTNEELQSTVEELETTNEELQSTNEELETMNEELQSTNDELQVINDELRRRTDELDRVNGFLEAVLGGLRAGVSVLDLDMGVQAWNNKAEDLWGLRRDEAVGQHFLNLDIGLPTEQVRPLIRQAVADGDGVHETTVTAINRRGRSTRVRVTLTALKDAGGVATGVILLMEPEPAQG